MINLTIAIPDDQVGESENDDEEGEGPEKDGEEETHDNSHHSARMNQAKKRGQNRVLQEVKFLQLSEANI